MFTFSPIHAWQADPAVQQILVFSNATVERDFHRLFGAELIAKGEEDADCKNKGAIYMLRAVKCGNDLFVPVIRCGLTGYLLWEDTANYSLPTTALRRCIDQLGHSIYGNLSSQLFTLV